MQKDKKKKQKYQSANSMCASSSHRVFISSKSEKEFQIERRKKQNNINKAKPQKTTKISNNNIKNKNDHSSIINLNNTKKIKFTGLRNTIPFSLFDATDAIKKIQLIKSSNNHVTKRHKISEKKINVIYYLPKEKKYTSIEMIIHYCEKCKVYFDFYDSFINQLKFHHVDINNLLLSYIDDNKKHLVLDNSRLNQHSLLNLYGYSVDAKKGLKFWKRQKLISYLITEKYMTPSEIKFYLEFFINFQGHKSNMKSAKQSWLDDIQFINDGLKNNKFKK